MFGLIKSVFSPLSAMKINEQKEQELDKKLHAITQYIINSPKQFDNWMQLQNKNLLHKTLATIYQQYANNQNNITEEQISAIIQFYTLLLSNCQDQLLLAKLVSDDLIFELCLLTKVNKINQEELDAYRINLWKSYLGTINSELIKYMVINDKFIVFQECCRMFKKSLGMVEQTTIANIILNSLKKANTIPLLWESMWKEEGLISIFKSLLPNMTESLKSGKNWLQVEENILFFIDVAKEITEEKLISQICENIQPQLINLVHEVKILQFPSFINAFSLIFPLCFRYRCAKPTIQQIIHHIPDILSWIENSLTNHSQIKSICRAIHLICRLSVSQQACLSVRLDVEEKYKQTRNKIGEIFFKLLRHLKEQHQEFQLIYILNMVKYSLLCLFNMFLGSNKTELSDDFCREILELFLSFIKKFQELFAKNEHWNTLIKWYEHDSNRVIMDLLHVPDNFQTIQDESCRMHVLILQYLRNYRYMIVDKTTLTTKQLKQQKFYFSQFNSPGCYYEPGKIVEEELKFICDGIFHHNYQQIPVSILNDPECFIFMYKMQNNVYKTIINVKFKAMEGFIYGNQKQTISVGNTQQPRFIKILLKGVQEIILQFPDPKVSGQLFRQYLIKQKDLSRQRELKFLKSWISKYEEDTVKTLQNL